MPYVVEITDLAMAELKAIKPFHRTRIVEAINQQLMHQPAVETTNRKVLIGLQPDFEHGEPLWELRVDQYRVYYDVSEESKAVTVQAVREKPPHVTTEQVV